jgi:hypothetical protein
MVPWLPIAQARPLQAAEIWEDAAAAGPDPDLVAAPFGAMAAVLLGRMGGPAFLPAELVRVAHLARVARVLLTGAAQ